MDFISQKATRAISLGPSRVWSTIENISRTHLLSCLGGGPQSGLCKRRIAAMRRFRVWNCVDDPQPPAHCSMTLRLQLRGCSQGQDGSECCGGLWRIRLSCANAPLAFIQLRRCGSLKLRCTLEVLVQPEMERRRSPLVSIPPVGRGFSRHRYDHQAIPRHGCVPAEPASVSPGKIIVAPSRRSVSTSGCAVVWVLRVRRSRSEAVAAHDLRQLCSVRRTTGRRVDHLGTLAEKLRT